MVERVSFHDEIRRNKIKSFFLAIIIVVIFAVIGYVISQIYAPESLFFFLILAIIASILYTLISYYNADKIALASVKAVLASPVHHRQLINSVENMALASGLPIPKICVMKGSQINAFASGRSPKHSVICFTEGALEKLNKQELEGVVAHEMSHIANYDIRFMTFTAVVIGMISIISELFLRSLWFSNSDSRDKKNGVLLIVGIVLAILAPFLANLVSLAISRKREFTADATGAKFTRYPKGLADALKKIKSENLSPSDNHRFPKAVAPLFISDPFKKKFTSLFSTHPSIDDRIAKLNAM
jgi:heat shock protein HtpX